MDNKKEETGKEALISLLAPPDIAPTYCGLASPASATAPQYQWGLSDKHSDRIYAALMDKITKGRRYRETRLTAKTIAEEIGTDPRYISATLRRHGEANFNAVVNGLRLRDACKMMRSPRYANLSAEEIGLLSGFASRQAFYKAFNKLYDVTPAQYRKSKG